MFEGEDDDGPDEPITPYAFPSAVKKSLKSEDDEQEDYRFEFFTITITLGSYYLINMTFIF